MKDYDAILIGSGAGMNIAARARQKNLKVAVVEHAPMGGTCLNRGCIPSKIFIHPADLVREMEHAKKLGIHASLEKTDFELISKRMWHHVLEGRHGMERGVKADKGMDFYQETGHFTAPLTLQVGKKTIHAPKIIIACGARPMIPPISGLNETGFLTSETVFDIKRVPSSTAIIGGGYIGCEFAHFLSAMGSHVSTLSRSDVLLPREEPEASAIVTKVMSTITDLRTGCEVTEVSPHNGLKRVKFRSRKTGAVDHVDVEEILVAVGVRSNADTLDTKSAGVGLDAAGYIRVNEYLETTAPGVWALGDVTGKNMFRHTANYESQVVWNNAFHDKKVKVDEHAVPHAVFTHPQVAGVGLTESEAKKRGKRILVGRGSYNDCAMGYAIAVEDSLIKFVVDADNMKLLGATVVGPDAAVLLQPIVYMMNSGDGTFYPIARSQIIHPALSEALVGALNDLHEPDAGQHEQHHVHKHVPRKQQ